MEAAAAVQTCQVVEAAAVGEEVVVVAVVEVEVLHFQQAQMVHFGLGTFYHVWLRSAC